MINEKLFNLIKENYILEYGDDCWFDGTTIKDMLNECDVVRETMIDKHRWYNIVEKIVRVGNINISYCDYDFTGDGNAKDNGLDFMEDTVEIVEPYETTVIDYRPVTIQ